MTFEVILKQMKYLRIHNVSIHKSFCIKIFLKFPERRKDGVLCSQK